MEGPLQLSHSQPLTCDVPSGNYPSQPQFLLEVKTASGTHIPLIHWEDNIGNERESSCFCNYTTSWATGHTGPGSYWWEVLMWFLLLLNMWVTRREVTPTTTVAGKTGPGSCHWRVWSSVWSLPPLNLATRLWHHKVREDAIAAVAVHSLVRMLLLKEFLVSVPAMSKLSSWPQAAWEDKEVAAAAAAAAAACNGCCSKCYHLLDYSQRKGKVISLMNLFSSLKHQQVKKMNSAMIWVFTHRPYYVQWSICPDTSA